MLIYIIKTTQISTKKLVDINKKSDKPSDILDQSLNNSIKSKLKFVTVMMKVMRTLREENELIHKLKGLCPGNKIPRGVILEGPNALKSVYEKYISAKNMDMINEKYPDTDIVQENDSIALIIENENKKEDENENENENETVKEKEI